LIGVAIFNVPFSIHCVSTTDLVIDAGMISIKRPLSLRLNDIFYASIIVLKRKLFGVQTSHIMLGFEW
jgi:hypothetical protein